MRALFLFDIDGTLISGDGAGRRSFNQACRQLLGIEDALQLIKLDGMTDPLILGHVYETYFQRQPTAEESTQVLSMYAELLAAELTTSKVEVNPGVLEVLDHLDGRGALLGLATGNIEDGARLKLERVNLWERFSLGGYGSDSAERAELVRRAVERAEVRAQRSFAGHEVTVIGDTPRDIAAARSAKVRSVGIATGSYSVDALTAAGADEAYPTMFEWFAARTF